jgi:hypothetical protein
MPDLRGNDMLASMRIAFAAAIAALMLSACAGNRYHAVEEAGGGQYYIGASPPTVVRYPAARTPLFAYGLSPWWGYSYYSPYFYPHYFSVSYSPWPYYASWPYYSYWPVAPLYGYPPYRRHASYHPGYHPGSPPADEGAGMPSTGNYGPPPTLPLRNAGRLQTVDDRSLQREMQRSGARAGQAWNSSAVGRSMAPPASATTAPPGSIRIRNPGSRSYGSPSAQTAGGHSSSRSGTGSGAVSRRNPRRHDQ